MKRDWTPAREKVEGEGRCRVCKRGDVKLDAAHVIPRSLSPVEGSMAEDATVPLCRECHTRYDHHQLDLLPYLSPAEQMAATRQAGGIAAAYRITTGSRL